MSAALKPAKKPPARRQAAELRESWLDARPEVLSRGGELVAELEAAPPDLPQAVKIWCLARALLAEAQAVDARSVAAAAEAAMPSIDAEAVKAAMGLGRSWASRERQICSVLMPSAIAARTVPNTPIRTNSCDCDGGSRHFATASRTTCADGVAAESAPRRA